MSGVAPVIEVHEPNRTVRRLMVEILEGAGFQVRQGSASPAPALVIFDVTTQEPQALDRLKQARERGCPVLYCGVRHQRDVYADEPWLDRPFSASALLTQCQSFLPPGTLLRRVRERSGVGPAVNPLAGFDEDEPSTREMDLDEASLLEVEFGLEPGVLGGDNGSGADASDSEEFVALDDDSELIVSEEDLLTGGRMLGAPRVVALDMDELDAADGALTDRMSLRLTGGQLPGIVEQPEGLVEREAITGPVPTLTVGSGELPLVSPNAALDPEAAHELRLFSRMLAEAWGKIGMTAGLDDRSDRIYRVLQSLLERGMDGASQELRRIPTSEGFSGSLGVLSLVGLLRTVRDRELRGRLEVSAGELAWVLYLDRGQLCDIDALVGADQDQLLIQGLVAEQLVDANQAAYLGALVADEDALMGSPLEMRILREGWLSAQAVATARAWRARTIFRQLCGQRQGVFAFIEIHPGDGQPWPAQELRLRVDELLLEVLREASLQTSGPEGSSRTRLMPDAQRIAALGPAALNDEERALLDFFRQGETLQQARLQMGQAPDDVDRLVRRLRRAELLRRSEGAEAPAAPPRSQPVAPVEAPATQPSASHPTPLLTPSGLHMLPTERTVVTEVSSADLRRMTQEEGAHPRVTRDPHEIPTRSVKAHSMAPPDVFESVDDSEDALRALLEQALDSSLSTRSDE